MTIGVDLPRVMVCFNHSSQKQTLDYLCIQPEEIKGVYENESRPLRNAYFCLSSRKVKISTTGIH